MNLPCYNLISSALLLYINISYNVNIIMYIFINTIILFVLHELCLVVLD